MINEIGLILAGFTTPMNIGTDPKSILWMFPLLASVAIVYKAVKIRVIFLRRFLKEVVILFCTISVVMIAAGVGLNLLVWILTG